MPKFKYDIFSNFQTMCASIVFEKGQKSLITSIITKFAPAGIGESLSLMRHLGWFSTVCVMDLGPFQKNPLGINDTKMKTRRLLLLRYTTVIANFLRKELMDFRISLGLFLSLVLSEQIYSKRSISLSVFFCSEHLNRDERLFKGFLKVKEERKERKKISSYNKERRR